MECPVGESHVRGNLRVSTVRTVVVGLLVVASGCASVPSTPPTDAPESPTTTTTTETTTATTTEPTHANATERPRKHPSLDSQLVGLLDAENRTRYADERGLRVRNDSVLVVVELRENRSLPAGFDLDVTARHDRLVQAWTPIDRLVALAEHGNVSFVRPPREPVADSLGNSHPQR